MQQKIKIIILLLLVISNNCSVLKKKLPADSGSEAGSFMDGVVNNNLTKNSFFIQKADVRLKNQDVTEKVTANVKFRAPDTMMVSIRTFAGIEAARFFITGDTILVNDRINKQILYGKPDNFYRRYGFSIGMAGIIFGDFLGTIKDLSGNINCKPGLAVERNIFSERNKIRYIIDCSSRKATYAEATSFESGQMIKFYYSGFRKSGKITYPVNIRIVNDQIPAEIEIEIKKIDIKWSGSIEFVPGAGYELSEIN